MEQIEGLLLQAIKEALSDHAKYFKITPAEILVDEDDIFSQMFLFTPLDPRSEDSKLVGQSHPLEFMAEAIGDDLNEITFSLMVAEDNQLSLTAGSIYCQLYWSEALEPI